MVQKWHPELEASRLLSLGICALSLSVVLVDDERRRRRKKAMDVIVIAILDLSVCGMRLGS